MNDILVQVHPMFDLALACNLDLAGVGDTCQSVGPGDVVGDFNDPNVALRTFEAIFAVGQQNITAMRTLVPGSSVTCADYIDHQPENDSATRVCLGNLAKLGVS
jgi:hypothetical protein